MPTFWWTVIHVEIDRAIVLMFLLKMWLLTSSVQSKMYRCVCVCVCVWLACLCGSHVYDSFVLICLCTDEEPDPRQMWLLVADQMSKFKGLGATLGLSLVQLRNIEGRHPEMVDRCMEVLHTWVEQETRKPVTWRTLITALREAKENKVASKVYREISSN